MDKRHKKLKVWKEAIEPVKTVYLDTQIIICKELKFFKPSAIYHLTSTF